MKTHLLFLFGLIMSTLVLAQAPQGISHQAVMRDAENNLIVESPIGLKVSIIQETHDGDVVYVEIHEVMTNAHGLITYIIGEGDAVEGVFAEIDWSDGPYWLKTKADPTGGENYSIIGITKFFSVPYSMYAEFAGYAETFAGLAALLARIEALEEALDIDDPEPGTVTDIDGNEYQTVIIGNQEWMAENLRVTKYKNGDAIPTGLSNAEWSSTTSGAYAIYPHEGGSSEDDVEGINSDEEMVAAYGKLYNWYAVNTGNLCPEGWSVPSDVDWTALVDYIMDEYDYHNDWQSDDINGVGNALKSCRQIGSPLEGCSTSEHPRWNSHDTHYGFDEFDFSAIPGGVRWSNGIFIDIGTFGLWWSTAEDSVDDAWARRIINNRGYLSGPNFNKSFGFSVRCFRDITEEPTLYNLNLEVHPEDAGTVSGEGEYEEGAEVSISATANEGWAFVNWTGDIEHLDDEDSAETFVTMPEQNISLTANFHIEYDPPDIIYGDGVTDIDGNEYVTVIIGDQEWMAENLRVTRYNNEDDIPTGLNDEDWGSTTEGAYAIYPHGSIDGLHSDGEVVAAYGKLYNWYAVDDSRGLCPQGWSVPSDADWTALVNYLVAQGYPNEGGDPNGAANALKSCRQDGHPDGGDCDTSEHPRWYFDDTHSGFDEFGFSALPGGGRPSTGSFFAVGHNGYWWSATDYSGTDAWDRGMQRYGDVSRYGNNMSTGFSVRCIRDN